MYVEHIKNNAPHKKSRGAHAPRLIYFFLKMQQQIHRRKNYEKKEIIFLEFIKAKYCTYKRNYLRIYYKGYII